MKTGIAIDTYTRFLLRENAAYIVIAIVLASVSLFLLQKDPLAQIKKNKEEISNLHREIYILDNKQKLLETLASNQQENLDEDVEIVRTLIPDIEDYFSIIFTLEELSKKTNFSISEYQINTAKSSRQKSSLKVTGVGDNKAFVNFLQKYNFGGGRLITAEEIELDPSVEGSIRLNINFYTQDVSQKNQQTATNSLQSSLAQTSNYQASLKRLEKIKDKVSIVLKTTDEASISTTYPTKSNPF